MSSRGIVTDLFIYKEKGQAGTPVLQVDCIKQSGIRGDIHALGGERQVTLQDLSIKKWMLKQKQSGICFHKFKENITIAGLDFEELKPGSSLCIGKAKLEITNWKKKCHTSECIIYNKANPCPFLKGCLFASITCSGSVFVGDEAGLMM